jgi:3-hydroxyisobutyrate dehydrogenase-like beta-hydroxyacid dehydrogenase
LTDDSPKTIGVIGLGTMGGAMAANLIKGGFEVIGFDIDANRCSRLAELGGQVVASASDVVGIAEINISSLPSPAALIETAKGMAGRCFASGRPVILETSTLAILDKHEACRLFFGAGIELLDCPLSGTGAQALTADLVVFGSGDEPSFDKCIPMLKAISHTQHYLGEFGNGTRMKMIANLLVAIHNAAAGEAFVLGIKAGLDPQLVYDVISGSAGTSRMLEVRGPMMVADDYDGATMKMDLWKKDMDIIGSFAKELGVIAPLFEASAGLYTKGLEDGRDKQDTASVCAVLAEMAGLDRSK